MFDEVGIDESGAVTIASEGGSTIWAGGGAISLVDGGHTMVILDSTSGQDESLTVTGTSVTASDLVENWGEVGQSADIVDRSAGCATVYGGAASTTFSGGNATIGTNQAGETGCTGRDQHRQRRGLGWGL